MSKTEEEVQDEQLLGSAVHWFTMLEKARLKNDFKAALEAQRELERLGIWVAYRAPIVS